MDNLSRDETFYMYFYLVNMETRCLDNRQGKNAQTLLGSMQYLVMYINMDSDASKTVTSLIRYFYSLECWTPAKSSPKVHMPV